MPSWIASSSPKAWPLGFATAPGRTTGATSRAWTSSCDGRLSTGLSWRRAAGKSRRASAASSRPLWPSREAKTPRTMDSAGPGGSRARSATTSRGGNGILQCPWSGSLTGSRKDGSRMAPGACVWPQAARWPNGKRSRCSSSGTGQAIQPGRPGRGPRRDWGRARRFAALWR